MGPYDFLRNLESRPPLVEDGLSPLASLGALTLNPAAPNINVRRKAEVAREQAALEATLVKIILSGDWESLKPNSGKAISIGEHNICVAFREDTDSGYRIWEWHGHLLMFDDEEGFTLEYVYGNHFQPLRKRPEDNTVDVGSSMSGIGLGGIMLSCDHKNQASILKRTDVLLVSAPKK